MTKKIRPYQLDLMRGVSEAYKAGHKGVMMQSCTGSGKTFTAATIVEKYTSTGRVVLWLTHREELLMQTALTFAHMGVRHRLVCADSSKRAIMVREFKECGNSLVDDKSLLVIASIQTIVRRLEKLDWLQPDQIIADEAHLSLADTWLRVIARWPDARLCGLSASPCRLDKKPFARAQGGMYDVMVLGPSLKWLQEQGSLAKFKIYAPPMHLKQGVQMKRKGNDNSPDSLAEELDVKAVYGDVISHYKKYSDGLPAIAQCPTVAVAEKFAQAFRDAGYKAICIEGKTDDGVRRDSLAALGRGEINVVTSANILTEGTDIPYATTAILLCRTESLAKYLQFVGRVLRPHPDKQHAIILDCVNVVEIHGRPTDDFEWTLEGEVINRTRNPKEGGQEISLITCPECHSIIESQPTCSECGHVFKQKKRKELVHIDAELGERTEEEWESLKRHKRAMQGQAQTVDELVAQGAKRKQAEKIVEARELKRGLQEDVLDLGDAVTKKTGKSLFESVGMGITDVRRAKPKELKAAITTLQGLLGAGNDNSSGGLNIRKVG